MGPQPGCYSQDVLNQSANDGVNFLCVQVQAENGLCKWRRNKAALDNTASNQDARFHRDSSIDGVDQAPVTRLYPQEQQ